MIYEILRKITEEDILESLEDLLDLVSKALSNEKRKVFVFLFEPVRHILRLLGVPEGEEQRKGCKADFSNKLDIINKLTQGKTVPFNPKNYNCEKLKDFEEILLYPIVSNNVLFAIFGIVGEKEMDEDFKIFAQLTKYAFESLMLKEASRKALFIGKITDILKEKNTEREIIDEILKALEDFYNSEITTFWKYELGKLVLNRIYGITEKDINLSTLTLDDSYEGKSINEKEAFIVIGRSRFNNMNPFKKELLSAMYSPVYIEDKPYGTIAIYNRKEGSGYKPYKHFDQLDLFFLSDLSKRLGLALSRIRYEQKLAEEIQALKELKEKHEKLIQLQMLQLEKLNTLHKISQAVRSTYDSNNAIKIMLLGLVCGRGFKFDRALYMIRDRKKGLLIPKLWIYSDYKYSDNGETLYSRAMNYGDLYRFLREESLRFPSTNELTEKAKSRYLVYKGHPILDRAVTKKHLVRVTPNMVKLKRSELEDILYLLETDEFVIIPIAGRWETIGVIIVDNKNTKKPIEDTDMEMLRLYQDSVGLALDMIESYEELKEKTRNLEEQRNLIDYYRRFKENILESLHMAVIAIDRTGKIIECNQTAEKMFLRPKEWLIGKDIKALENILGEDLINTIEQIYMIKEPFRIDNLRMEIGGEEKFLDIQMSPLYNLDIGVVEGVIVTINDVTESYKLEQEIAKREKLAAIGEMTARIAHEIRNPLTVIGGFVQRIIKNLSKPERVKKYVTIIREELARLENILTEILEYSRGSTAVRFEELNLNELVEDVIMMYEDIIEKRNIKFEFVKLDEKILFNGDRSKIKQVIINLIKNSIDAVEENEGEIKITTGKIDDKSIFFEIENNGEPIPKENQTKIFSPFFTTKLHGTGLGLPISKKIIEEEHRGKLELVKSDEESTIFRFEIPISR